MLAAASFCPLVTPNIPALTFSAIKVAVYMDKDKANAISSGIIFNPPSNVKIVGESCFSTGYSKDRLTPKKRNVINGKAIKINSDIINIESLSYEIFELNICKLKIEDYMHFY